MDFLQYKDFSDGVVKDVDTKNGIVTGYLSKFENKDLHGDVIVKGAFKRSLDARKDRIRFLNQHNWAQPHGFFKVLQEDNYGLYFESNPLVGTSYSKDAIILYSEGIISEHSIGFEIKQQEKEGDANILKEIKLYEGSNVTMGANPETPFTGFKSLTKNQVDDKLDRIIKFMRKGNVTDETFDLLEIALKQLQKESIELGMKTALESGNSGDENPTSLKDSNSLLVSGINEYLNLT